MNRAHVHEVAIVLEDELLAGDRRLSLTSHGFQIARRVSDDMDHWVVPDVARVGFVELVDRLTAPTRAPAPER